MLQQGNNAQSALQWAEQELDGVDLSDARLAKRLKSFVASRLASPHESIPGSCLTWSQTKGAYRFLSNDKVEPEAILEPHRNQAIERARGHRIVLAVNDTTVIKLSSHPATAGLGPINKSDLGFLCHPTVLVTPGRLTLGVIDAQNWVRDPLTHGKKLPSGESPHHKKPIEEKESSKWLDSLVAANDCQKALGESTLVVSVSDRESDIFLVLEQAVDVSTHCKLLVRAKSDRRVVHEEKRLWEQMGAERVAGKLEVDLPPDPGKRARTATLTVRFANVTLRRPWGPLNSKKKQPVQIWAVLVREERPPRGEDPLEWMLLTTLPVTKFRQAVRVVNFYACRWTIEVFFRILKTGCQFESKQLQTYEALERCLVIDMVITARIAYLTHIGREHPEWPCTVVFTEDEWQALWIYVHRKPKPPKRPIPLGEAIRMVARLAGYLDRKSDGPPGAKHLGIGMHLLGHLAAMRSIVK